MRTYNIGEPTINKAPSPHLRWAFTLSYLFFIYATLGIARPIVELLRTTSFLKPTVTLLFVICILLALGWRYATIGKSWMVLRVILITSLPALALFIDGMPEERLHFLTYGLLGWLICWSVEATEKNLLWSKNSWLFPCLLVWLAGGIDELIQWWLPVRVFDVRDILLNGVGGMLGIALFATGNRK